MEKQNSSPVKTVSFVMVLTLLGKVMGLIRDRLLTVNYGLSTESNAFLVASRIPRVFFDVIFASAIAACFIPVFTEYLGKRGKNAAFRFSGSFLTVIGLVTLALSGVGMVLAQPLVDLMADGFDAETAALCVRLTRIMFPSVFFTGAAFSFVGILQSLGEFNIPALISSVSNGLIILYFLALNQRFGIYGLAVTYLVAWSLQALVQLPALFKRGWRFYPDPHPWNEGMKKVLVLLLPAMVSTWAQPINLVINARFGSHLLGGDGASVIDLANNLYLIVASVFVLSVTNVMFPKLSQLEVSSQSEAFQDAVRSTLHGCLFFVFPMMAGMMVISVPLIDLIYGGGAFDAASVEVTGKTMMFVSLGMVGYGVQNILSRAYFARQNGRIPLIASCVSVAVNLAGCLLLTGSLGMTGLALSSAIASAASALVMLIPMGREGLGTLDRSFWLDMVKTALATLVMAAVAWAALQGVTGLMPGTGGKLLRVAAPALAGAVVYFALALLLHLPEMSLLTTRLKERRGS
jgi:putative peptidoglycan lipid II flippase